MHHPKRTYRTYNEALRNLLHATKKRKTPLRIYPCSDCHGYHLTKQRRPPRRRAS